MIVAHLFASFYEYIIAISWNGVLRVGVVFGSILAEFERKISCQRRGLLASTVHLKNVLHSVYSVYQNQCYNFKWAVDEYGLSVKCVPHAMLWSHFEPIVWSWDQFVAALVRIKWASFEPAEEMV